MPIDKATEYAAEDADVTLRLWKALKARLAAEHVATVYETLERPLVPVLARMEGRGISIDRQMLSRLSGEFAQKQARARGRDQQARRRAVQSRQPEAARRHPVRQDGAAGRHQDQDRRMVDRRARAGRARRAGPRAAAQDPRLAAALEAALDLHRRAAELRQPGHQRVHTSYALAATTTGRLSSSEPNLQNIPIRTEEGRKIRRAFVAEPGNKLVSADYSQIELRLLAEIADVPQLKKAFRDGLDIHAMTASEMFGVPVKDMPGEVRRRAKAINFGIIYGISAFGLANQLGIDREEAGAYIKKYFERFPGIRDYMEETKTFASEHGYVLTLFGRKCHYPDIKASEPVDPRLQRARRDQRAPAGLRRRHHPPRHDPHGAGAGEGEAQREDAAAGARRTDLRGAGGRGREDAAAREEGDGGRADAGGVALGAAVGRCARGAQLGRGALGSVTGFSASCSSLEVQAEALHSAMLHASTSAPSVANCAWMLVRSRAIAPTARASAR